MTASNIQTAFTQATFKPVEGGYLYEMPNRWVFGPTRRYIVNEAQKLALLDIMRPMKPRQQTIRIVLTVAAVIAYTCGVSLLWAALSPRENPGALDVLGMAVTILVPLYAAMVFVLRPRLRRIELVVASAVPTQARLAAGEHYQATLNAMPTKWLAVCALIWSISALTSLGAIAMRSSSGRPIFSDFGSYMMMMNGAIGTGLTVLFVYVIYKRQRSKA